MKKNLQIVCSFLLLLFIVACNDIEIYSPPGPSGMSAYDIWKEQVENGTVTWPKDKVEVEDFMVYIKGEKGDKGEDGKSAYQLWKDMISTGEVANPHNPSEKWNKNRNSETDFWDYLTGRDGVSPHIGDNGNWWIGDKDTDIVAKGKDGADGEDGITPHIGTNGNWWIGITDTNVPAKGQDGIAPHIGDNGNWWIGDKDTGKPSKGNDGSDGKSAYESWRELAQTGDLDDPKNPNEKWDKNKVDIEHFIQYLTGANGKDGIAGKDGVDGQTPHIDENGNWWIGDKDTGVAAKGQDGKDGVDGYTPYIGNNGNWWINGADTGQPSKGVDGKNGVSPNIGDNGNWWIDGIDTGKPARGESGAVGTNGSDGKSAYELWIEDVKAGKIKDKEGSTWPSTEITQADFWKYLKGKDGADGTNGTNGINGVDGQSAYEIWKGMVEAGSITDKDGDQWPVNKNTETDFWLFLMGKDGAKGEAGIAGVDGQSAYSLWVTEVKAGNIKDKEGNTWPATEVTQNDFWKYLRGKDGQDATDKQRTSLSFVSSTQDGDHEIFVFQTDAGAIVTMNYRDITVSGVADASGVCSLRFPNSKTEELPVVVYAEAPNKRESSPISVKVRIDGRSYISYAHDAVKWYDRDGNLLDNSTEEYGKFVDGEVPYYSIEKAISGLRYITIPFEASGIESVTFAQSGGFAQLNITSELDVAGDYSKGVIKIQHTGGVWMVGTVEVTMTAKAYDGTVFTNKIKVEPKEF